MAGAKIFLKDVRLTFNDLFEATQYEGKGAFRYNASFLVEPGSENDKKILAAISEAAVAEFGKKAAATLASIQGNPNKLCYIAGDRKEYEGYAGMMVLSTHRRLTDGKPGVIDQLKNPLTAADGKPYSGCYVNATVSFFGYKQGGISAGVQVVQFARDGDAFSGAGKPNFEDFEELTAGADAEELV